MLLSNDSITNNLLSTETEEAGKVTFEDVTFETNA